MAGTKKYLLEAKTFYPVNRIIEFILANLALSFLLLLVFVTNPFRSVETFLIGMAWSFAICSTQWLGHGLIFDYFDRKISWIKQPVKRSLWGLAALVVYSIVAFFAIQSLMNYLVNGRIPTLSWDWLLGNVFYPVAISFVITLTLTAVGFFNAWKNAAVRAEKLNTEMMAYKYEVLRNQINPHFLFNSFNVLTDLVYEDQSLAVKFIQRLSSLFRYVLESREKELVTLKEELEFVDSFAYLLKVRFENKLKIDIDTSPGYDELIVPVSIQMLIENAVKHNEVSDAYPLEIQITKDKDYIGVTNTLRPKAADDESTRLGLRNLRQQFDYFTDRQIEIKKTGQHFTVRLPVIKSEKPERS